MYITFYLECYVLFLWVYELVMVHRRIHSMKMINILFGLFFLNSCSVNDSICDKESKTEFEKYICEIPLLSAGFSLTCAEQIEHHNFKSEFTPEGAGIVGRLKSIGSHSFIIYSYPADIRLPILEVYDQKGEKINETPLFDEYDCSIDSPTTSSRFRIENETTIIIERIKPENGAVNKTITVNLNGLIKKAKP